MNKNQVLNARPQSTAVAHSFMRAAADLGPTAIAVYAALCYFADLGDDCDPSVPEIAKMIGCSQNPARTALAKLEKEGWIAIETRKLGPKQHDTNVYTILFNPEKEGVLQNQNQGGSESEGKSTTTTGNGSVSKRKPIVVVWEEEAREAISPHIAERLFALVDEHGEQTAIDAVKEASATVGPGQFNVKYVESILRRWEKEGRDKPKPARIDADPLDGIAGLTEDLEEYYATHDH